MYKCFKGNYQIIGFVDVVEPISSFFRFLSHSDIVSRKQKDLGYGNNKNLNFKGYYQIIDLLELVECGFYFKKL